jgi:hypothetical protein
VDSVKVSVRLYVPVCSGSVAFTRCLNVIVSGSLDTGPAHAAFESSTTSGCGSANDVRGIMSIEYTREALPSAAVTVTFAADGNAAGSATEIDSRADRVPANQAGAGCCESRG